MSTFEDTQSKFTQEQFEVLEIDLPVITGTCTVGGVAGYGTPLTCDQAWTNEYKTYKFTTQNAPVLSGGIHYRCIEKIKEKTTELKPSSGLSSRGSLSITLTDFIGDPNTETAGVTTTVKNQGTFFGKLAARQVFDNKAVRLKLYRVEADGTIDLVNGAQTHYYIIDSLKATTNNQWVLECKDVLSLANLNEKTWPMKGEGQLRTDIDNAVIIIPVDAVTDYSSAFAVRVGEEFLEVTSVTDNQLATAALNVTSRGSSISAPTSGKRLTRTVADEHKLGDEVFICSLSDDETIDSLLARILTDSDLDPALIPTVDWAAEVAEWHAMDKINTLHHESRDVNTVLKEILTGFLMNMWFDQIDNEVKLSAISPWKESSSTLTEGRQIDAHTLKFSAEESIRASRAIAVFDKPFLSADDSTSSYAKASRFTNDQLISAALYGEHKDKLFNNNTLIDSNAADLLTQRYVSMFGHTPYNYTGVTQERFLDFKVGDVVNLDSINTQSASGLPSGSLRAQVTNIAPQYKKTGREYKIKAMSYEAAFSADTEIVLSSPLSEVSLHVLAGAPSQAVTLTFVLDGSYSQGATAISAGNFATGSKIILILVNGFDAQANGGNGGNGGGAIWDSETSTWSPDAALDGSAGGTVYNADGVDTDIYFSGATTSIAFPIADGYIRAPSGGAGGFDATFTQFDPSSGVGGNGGNGGDGRSVGVGGTGGFISVSPIYPSTDGSNGSSGTINGSTSGWGNAGANNDATGGAAGSGVIDGGATVTFYGDTAARYINGAGDH